MLVALRVRNFVLIDQLELRFHPGLNVLTGETGAGKSILIGALGLVLGGRARSDTVRPGCDQAEIEALFDIEGHLAIARLLSDAGLDPDAELIIRRVVTANGRSRAYINGRLCTAKQLSALAQHLADITSQHESVALANPAHHISHLDDYANLSNRRTQLAALVDELHAQRAEIRLLIEQAADRAEREEFLRYQLEAIDAVAPKAGEHDALREELARLEHAGTLRSTISEVATALESDDNPDQSGVCDSLATMVSRLHSAAELDRSLLPHVDELNGCWSQLRDLASVLHSYGSHIEANPARLEELHERLYQLEALLRRHGPQLDDVLQARERIARGLEEIGHCKSRVPELQQNCNAQLEVAAGLAKKLSQRRRAAAKRLGRAITAELAQLGMGAARVLVDVAPRRAANGDGDAGDSSDSSSGNAKNHSTPKKSSDKVPASQPAASDTTSDGTAHALLVKAGKQWTQLGRDGIDRVQFLIAPNKGMSPRPLRRIASGGELSRALLALKRALADSPASASNGGGAAARVGVQIFDEVDTGVGGVTADRIGRAMASLATRRQVLCITHLASLAAYGDAHFVVEKDMDSDDVAVSVIREVDHRQRIAELARMLSGTKSSAKAAAELLASAAATKQTEHAAAAAAAAAE